MTDEKKKLPGNVYAAIAQVQAALAKEGIGKDRKNKEQGYSFRGIDDLYNSLATHLSQAGLCILPRILGRELKERTSSKGNPLFNVVVEAEFDFVSAADGSKHTVKTFGEAMDMADKATNKAMSAAYKYACLQTFCIPTEGDNDADGTTPDVAPPARGVFESVELREKLVENCVEAINRAQTVEELRNQRVLNMAKWAAMKESAPDIDAYNAIIDAYNARFKHFTALAEPTKPKPQTVEDVKKMPAAVLGDDQVPF